MYYQFVLGFLSLSASIYVYRKSIMNTIDQVKTLYDLVSNVESTRDLGEFMKLDATTGYVAYQYNGGTRYIFFKLDGDEFAGMGQEVIAIKDDIKYNITPPAGSRLNTTSVDLGVDYIQVENLEYHGNDMVEFPTETDLEF
jgi:hypothetical protein